MSDFIKFTKKDGATVILRKNNIIQLFQHDELRLIYYYQPDTYNIDLSISSDQFTEDYNTIAEELLE